MQTVVFWKELSMVLILPPSYAVVVPAVSTGGSKWVAAPEGSSPHWGFRTMSSEANLVSASLTSALIWSFWGKISATKLLVKKKKKWCKCCLATPGRLCGKALLLLSSRTTKSTNWCPFFRVCFFHVSQLESFLMSHSFPVMAADSLFAALEIQFAWK